MGFSQSKEFLLTTTQMGFKYFDTTDIHSEFAVMEINRHEILSDKQRYHFFELPKLPNVDLIDKTSEKDTALAEKDMLIAQLQAQLKK